MRLVLIGQAPFGAKTLEALLDKGHEVAAVYTPAAKPGTRPDPLEEAAAARGIPAFQPTTFKDDGVFEHYKAFDPELTVMAFVTAIIPVRYFDAASRGTICYHPSLLPRHRGASAINWAIILGETRTGLTIFWPNEGIDAGPILLQKEVAISPDDTTGSLYFNHLFPMGVDALVESVELIRTGRASRIPQDESQATYEPPCDDRVARVEWQKSARDVYNLVRGCDPQPGAYTTWGGEKIRFYGARLRDEPSEKAPGSILGIDAEGIHVAAVGGRLIVGSIRASTGGKISAAEWAREKGLSRADDTRPGSNPAGAPVAFV